MTNFFRDRSGDARPFVCVDVVGGFPGDHDGIPALVQTLAERAVDAVNLPLYRTPHLVSMVHCSEEAAEYRDRQIDRETFADHVKAARDNDVMLSATVYDPELMEWYDDNVEVPYTCLHGGDITYRRLLEKTSDLAVHPVVSTAAATRNEIEQALGWVDDEDCLLLYEPIDSEALSETGSERRLNWLADTFDHPVGFRDPGVSREALRAALSGGIDFWMPVLGNDGPPGSGYGVEDLAETIQALNTGDVDPEDSTGRGDGDLDPAQPAGDVQDYRNRYRRSLMASRSLSAGDSLADDMVRELRPGSGLPADKIHECVGMMIPRPTDPQEMIAY